MNELTNVLDSVGGIAGNVLGALNQPKQTAAPAAQAPSSPNLGLIAAIGGGVLVLLVIVLSLGGRK